MKKLLLFLMLIIGLSTQAQNFIGFSFRDIKGEMDRNGYILSEGYDKDGDYYLSARTSLEFKVYYFTKNNICTVYVYTLKNVSFSDYEQSLYKNGYSKYSNGKYYSDKYIAKIEYDYQFSSWYVTMEVR
jgi:hypothetical protein